MKDCDPYRMNDYLRGILGIQDNHFIRVHRVLELRISITYIDNSLIDMKKLSG